MIKTLSVMSCPNGGGSFALTAINTQTGVPNTVTGALTVILGGKWRLRRHDTGREYLPCTVPG